MRKRTTFITWIILLSLLLAACSSAAATGETDTTVQTSGTPIPGTDTAAGELPESMQLVLGTLQLADSDTPITSEQAAVLLPLWKAVRSLGNSDTAAQAEIDALYVQIRGTLSEEQIAAIEEMELTPQTMMAISEELGIDTGFGSREEMTPAMQATMDALRASGEWAGGPGEGGEPPEGFEPPSSGGMRGGGEMPGGGGMAGGGDMPPGDVTGFSPEQLETAQASGATNRTMNNTINSMWLDALISILEEIAAQ
ncbi:MAG: hypothetical protein JW726_04175 [Anaerolineales bacterium]|nr:hypothetical protein [Anaerolineales bacterium]